MLLASISNSLETELANKSSEKLRNFQVCQQLDIAMFSNLSLENGLKGGVVLLLVW